MIQSVLFVAVAATLCGIAILAILGITSAEMAGSDAIGRDGLSPGSAAPAWELADSSGRRWASPPRKPLQLIVFADHSLKSFPSLAAGLRAVRDRAADLEMVILLRGHSDIAEPVIRLLGLADLPVLAGSPALYGRYNVRVMPWAMIVDSGGRVRASSLVNDDWQVEKLWRIAQLPPPGGRPRPAVRSRLPFARAGV